MTVVLACPKCGTDVPCEDLSNFVRYYNGDEGYEQCPECDFPILWKMSISANIASLPPKELLLMMGKAEADLAQLYAWGADPDAFTPDD